MKRGRRSAPHSGLGRAGYTDGGLHLVFRPFRGSGQILSKVKYSDSRIPASSTPMAGAMPIRSGCFFEIPAQMTDRFDQPAIYIRHHGNGSAADSRNDLPRPHESPAAYDGHKRHILYPLYPYGICSLQAIRIRPGLPVSILFQKTLEAVRIHRPREIIPLDLIAADRQ